LKTFSNPQIARRFILRPAGFSAAALIKPGFFLLPIFFLFYSDFLFNYSFYILFYFILFTPF